MRALENWSAHFQGPCWPRSERMERHFGWKIPVHASLVQGRQTTLRIQSCCVAELLAAAAHLAAAADAARGGYNRAACLITWPWLHQSEVTIFYDQAYYASFLGTGNVLAPRRVSEGLGVTVPAGFVEFVTDITQPEDRVPVELWCGGEAL